MNTSSFLVFVISFFIVTTVNLPAAPSHTPVKVIFDTDMSGDVDDIGALAVLNELADLGEAEILACVANGFDKDKAIAASISVINTYYGRPQIPIGTYQGTASAGYHYRVTASHYTARLRDEFPHHALPDDQMPRAVDIYRTALAKAPDRSVTIISVGFLANLRDLLTSNADAASSLSGLDLIKQKVKHLVVMGGGFPHNGGEFNFIGGCHTAPPDTRYVAENWPTGILFTGFEIGGAIITTPHSQTPLSNPVRRAYELYGSLTKGRQSWDLTAVLAAVRDPLIYWDVQRDGYCNVSPSGANAWTPTPNRGHSYLVAKVPSREIVAVLEQLMTTPPVATPTNTAKTP